MFCKRNITFKNTDDPIIVDQSSGHYSALKYSKILWVELILLWSERELCNYPFWTKEGRSN